DGTIIMPNHPSALKHPEIIDEYIQKELVAGRFRGPFTKEDMESIMQGPFISSPFIVSEQEQGPGLPPKFRVCRNLSKETKEYLAVNSFIKKDQFPTRFDTAVKIAEV
ncbi:hypothetical protein MPER_00104, partial [Moniliophthora perniciosa FA553]